MAREQGSRSAPAQLTPPAAATGKRPPPLPVAQTPPADPCAGRRDLEEDPAGPGRPEDRPVRKPAGGFPVILVCGVGGAVLLGAIAGLMVWKLLGADPRPKNRAIVQKAPATQDRDPAPVAIPEKKKSEPAGDVPDRREKDPAPAVPPGEKEAEPASDVPAVRPRRLNLMSIVDLNVDVVEGKDKWRLQDKTLICDTGHFVPRVQIRFVPPEEYDFSVTFAQGQLRNGVSLLMPKPGGGMFVWTVGCRNGSGYGFGPDGRDIGGNAKWLIQLNRVHTTTVQVRRGGVRGLLDGRVIVTHPTDFGDLTIDNWRRMPNQRVLGVACDDPTTFYRILLVEVTGTGEAIP